MKPNRPLYLTIGALLLPISLMAQGSEYRLGLSLRSSDRNLHTAPSLGSASATLRGAELLLRNDGVALGASYYTGDFGATSGTGGTGPLREARVFLGFGPRALTVEGGYYRRARGSSLSEQSENMVHVGARSTINLGPSGFVISFGAGTVIRSDSTTASTSSSSRSGLRPVGWNAETALLFQAPRGLPFYATLGYRYERINSNHNITPISHEELSAVVFGVGLRFMSKKKEVPEAAMP